MHISHATRLNAENIRDQAIGDQWDFSAKKIGGPSVYPVSTEGDLESTGNKERHPNMFRSMGKISTRRSMYTIWKRSSPPPAMLSFDAPDRYYCVVRRQQTATPITIICLDE